MATEPFATRLRHFYDGCTPEEQQLLAAMCALFLGRREPEVEGYRSDVGQKFQLQLQEANNIYTRAVQAQSNISSKYHQTLQGIARNLGG